MDRFDQVLTIDQVSRIEQTYAFASFTRPSNNGLSNVNRKLPLAVLCALLNTAAPIPSLATQSVDVTSVVMTTNSALQATTESEEFRKMVLRARLFTKKQKIRAHKISELDQEVSLNNTDFKASPVSDMGLIPQRSHKARVRVRKTAVDTPSNINLAELTSYNIDLSI
ncbi:hypothetical protein [Hymenobacter sp. BT559]|uniref:hypothetical protein n=1 Tax=Hymenobacter sp. BT559 TaxID=2795729 RepID=UPI0018ECE61B|nr:hypothetical protein [Hymenobacter sp. BT559]MBJ6145841.1 hypothetical protein [Hymenobacter sp. BT559]